MIYLYSKWMHQMQRIVTCYTANRLPWRERKEKKNENELKSETKEHP